MKTRWSIRALSIRALFGALLLLPLLALSGCAPEPVVVDLRFPSESTLLFSEFARILVFPLESGELGRCPELTADANSGNVSDALIDTGTQPVCSFRQGGVSFEDMPSGPFAYVALVEDDSNQLLLDGCTVAEVYEDAPRIQISLFPTEDYATLTAGMTPACPNVETKCGGGC